VAGRNKPAARDTRSVGIFYTTGQPILFPLNRQVSGTIFAREAVMSTTTSSDPKIHSQKIQKMLDELIAHSRRDLEQVDEPRFQALLETTAEVLLGLKTAFHDYNEGKEKAWQTL
jgi:hypothetical protein